jgi:signal transduction histidine kinase
MIAMPFATSDSASDMRERVALLRGTLDIDSAPGSGTRLRITLPRQQQTDHARARRIDRA